MNLTPRNRLIIRQRAEGRTVQSIAVEHGLSPARVSVICRDYALRVRVAELEAEVARLRDALVDISMNGEAAGGYACQKAAGDVLAP